jgi:hypothetical protein
MSGFVKFAIVASVYTVTIGALFVLMGVFWYIMLRTPILLLLN